MNTVQKSKHWKVYVGENVILNEGGHSTDRGRLLDIGSNFLVLAVENEHVCYHQMHHVSDVSIESYKGQGADIQESVDTGKSTLKIPQYYHSLNFRSLLRLHIGKEVLFNQGEDHPVKGIILDVTRNFVILKAKKDVLYFNIYFIKNIIEIENPDKDGEQRYSSSNEKSYIYAHSYERLFQLLEGFKVSIQNRNLEEAEGIIHQMNGRYILEGKAGSTLINTEQVRSVTLKAELRKEKSEDTNREKSKVNSEKKSHAGVYSQVIKTVDFHWKK